MADVVSGVYRFLNTINGKVYIGSSTKVFERRRGHLQFLRRGEHHSTHLQNAFNKYGEGFFAFSVLEEVPPVKELLLAAEQRYMDQTQCCNPDRGYNMSPTASSPLGVKHSAEALARCRAGQRATLDAPGYKNPKKGTKLSAETKAKMSAAKKGTKLLAEHKAKISAALKGRKFSEETKAKRRATLAAPGYKNPNKGKKHSAEHIAKMSAANKGQVPWNKDRKRLMPLISGVIVNNRTNHAQLSLSGLSPKYEAFSPIYGGNLAC